MVNDFFNILFVYRWPPPDQTVLTYFTNYHYQTAWYYFGLNLAWILIALLWGFSVFNALRKYTIMGIREIPISTALVIYLAAGISIFIAELFLLVLFKALTPWHTSFVVLATTVMALGLIVLNRSTYTRATVSLRFSGVLIVILLTTILLAYQLSAARSWHLGDGTSYHVPYAAFFLQNKGLSAFPEYLIFPYHSLNFNLLYSAGLMINSDLSYLQTLHATFATLSALGIYAFCVATGQRQSIAILMTCIFLAILKNVHYNRLASNVDCGSMFFVLTTQLALYAWIRYRASWLLFASAVFMGIAMGTKYIMALFALPIAALIIMTDPKNWKNLCIYAFIAALWGLWWYIRNAIYTGNPVHPFANGIFGYYLWDEYDVSYQYGIMLEERVPRTLRGLLLMPYYAFKNSVLASQRIDVIVTMIYLSTLCFRLIRKDFVSFLLFCWAYLIFWLGSVQDPRYLMPITPLALVLFGAVCQGILDKTPNFFASKLIHGATFAMILSYTIIYLQQQLVLIYYSHLGDSPAEADAFMRYDPTYDLISHANEIFNKQEAVYEIGMRDGRWFYRGNLVGNQFGPHGYVRLLKEIVVDRDEGIPAEKFEEVLRSRYSASGFILPNANALAYNAEAFDARFDQVYKNSAGVIYKLKDLPIKDSHGRY